ncbi:hypothetical protein KVT40_007548 [Elsinoe batatas]|uniref:Uncharacterized protein n=1 Tax=Elsinoe batatas TaxID=2601811 RepID=A0A8K0PCE3_9PEZI|nr:hypothetical protein KVT40_007548 [Elsinoe batatas]
MLATRLLISILPSLLVGFTIAGPTGLKLTIPTTPTTSNNVAAGSLSGGTLNGGTQLPTSSTTSGGNTPPPPPTDTKLQKQATDPLKTPVDDEPKTPINDVPYTPDTMDRLEYWDYKKVG